MRANTLKAVSFILLIFISVSCSKQIINNNSSVYNRQLEGKWNWIRSTGGFAGHTISQETLRYTMGIQFKNDSVLLYRDGKITQRHKFAIIKGRSIFTTDSAHIIKYADGGIDQVIQKVNADTLVLADNVNDGYTLTYIKEK
ncbi:MAG: hypothetical protein EOP46_13595 [Sphingobacteriaceae bacterium]|nr:MAG: hypothetical protein EOP46_13595 [Sphingobacteriaceae bacterium]